jgi:hypothetical protein
MKGQLYAEFYERRGRRIFEAAGHYWYEAPCRMLMSIPYHEQMNPPPEAIHELLGRTKHAGARYLCPAGIGLSGGLYLRRSRPFDIMSVQNHKRTRMRKALSRCVVREVEKAELEAQGLAMNLETMERQGRFDPEFGWKRPWRRLLDACYGGKGVKVMGSFVKDELAAYAVTLEEDGGLHILHQFSANRFLNECYPNDALTFTITKSGMDNGDIEFVSYGVAGLTNGDTLHNYKLRNGYEFIPYGYAFVLHDSIDWLLANSLSVAAADKAYKWFPRLQFLERVASVAKGARFTKRPHLAMTPSAAMEESVHG